MKKKIIPVLAAILLIAIVGAIGVLSSIIEKYTPTDEQMDATSYYGISGEDDLALVMGNELIAAKGKLYDGVPYIDYNTVITYLNDRFYWDANENILLYTIPTDIISVSVGSKDFYISKSNKNSENYVILKVDGETAYIAAEFVQKYTNIEFELLEEPNRLLVDYQWGTVQVAEVKKEDNVRYQGGIKSPILEDLKKGDKVTVLEELEDWTKVKTEAGYIGYIPNSKLSETREETVQRAFEEYQFSSMTRDYTINLVWHVVTNQDANSNLLNDIADTKGLTTISPTWFRVKDVEGNITTDLASKEYVTRAHDNGLEVWGVVDNFDDDEAGIKVSIHDVLTSSTRRQNLVSKLIAAAIEYQLDGINVDFEEIAEETGEAYVQFIRELSAQCRKMNIILSVDVPITAPYTEHYNRAELGIMCDYVIIMSYDEYHVNSEEAGSVASLPWVREAVEAALTEVPASKIINGVPFYTRIWTEVAADGGTELKSEAVGMNYARNFFEEHEANGATINWSDDTSQYYAEVELTDGKYKCWLEEDESIDAKAQLIKEYDLAGIAAWRLGYEKSSVWDVIYKYTN